MSWRETHGGAGLPNVARRQRALADAESPGQSRRQSGCRRGAEGRASTDLTRAEQTPARSRGPQTAAASARSSHRPARSAQEQPATSRERLALHQGSADPSPPAFSLAGDRVSADTISPASTRICLTPTAEQDPRNVASKLRFILRGVMKHPCKIKQRKTRPGSHGSIPGDHGPRGATRGSRGWEGRARAAGAAKPGPSLHLYCLQFRSDLSIPHHALQAGATQA